MTKQTESPTAAHDRPALTDAEKPAAETAAPLTLLQLDSSPHRESVRSLTYPPEILALAEEIADGSDVIGIETMTLDFLLRAVLYADRLSRRA